jgi:hypothetical protein
MTTIRVCLLRDEGRTLLRQQAARYSIIDGARWVRSLRAMLLVVVSMAALAGCTLVRLGYNNAAELGYRWIDGYIDFNDEQAVKARAGLEDLMRWHRKSELPVLAQWLDKQSREITRDTTPAEICAVGTELRDRSFAVLDRALPAAADIAVTLTDAQIAHLQKRMDRGNAKFRDEYGQKSPADREESTLERSISRAEMIYGSIDDKQRAVLARAAKTPSFDPEVVLAERVVRQRELVQMVRTARKAAQDGAHVAGARDKVVSQLRVDLERWVKQGTTEFSPRPAYRAYLRKMQDYNCELSAQVHNAALPATRQAARERMKGWETDARALHAAAE